MPSKLFVGNLPDNVEPTRLKQIFQPFCKVTECDIVKNYAFVHVDEDEVDPIIQRLTGYTIDGKTINIKKSTSKLRPTPGMPNRCFRCQSDDHRTPQCPQDPKNIHAAESIPTIKVDLTGNVAGVKRSLEALSRESKRPAFQAPYTVDPEIPRPTDPDLQQLYQEYQSSRQRYAYYRDRLLKEMEAKQHGSTEGYALSSSVLLPSQPEPVTTGSTQLSSGPVSYQQLPNVPPSVQAPSYSSAAPVNTSLRAPYAAPPQFAPYNNNSISTVSSVVPPTHYGLNVPHQPPSSDNGVTSRSIMQNNSIPGMSTSSHVSSNQSPYSTRPGATMVKWT